MVEHSRYHASDEAIGVSNGILKNKLGITNQKQLEYAETLLLADTYTYFFELLNKDKVKFDLSLLYFIHKYFLITLYAWAGKIRTVNISKDGIFFAPAKYIDKAMEVFEGLVNTTLPNQSHTIDEISQKLAVIHNEFNVIHPFREGNGRTIRLFLDLIAASLGYNPIDWSKKSNNAYMKACVEGTSGKHESMTKIIRTGLKISK